jgi:hypothetical protein
MKVLTINDTGFALPEGMTFKEIQALAGTLATLTRIEYRYDDVTYDKYYFAAGGSQISITETEVMTKEAALAKAKVKREAKEAAEAAAKAAAEATA